MVHRQFVRLIDNLIWQNERTKLLLEAHRVHRQTERKKIKLYVPLILSCRQVHCMSRAISLCAFFVAHFKYKTNKQKPKMANNRSFGYL